MYLPWVIIDPPAPDADPHERLALRAGLVRPIRYDSAELRAFVGDLIGRTGSNDLLAGHLWLAEGRAARSALDDLSNWEEVLTNATHECQQALLQDDFKSCVHRENRAAISSALNVFQHELALIAGEHAMAMGAFKRLREHFGFDVTGIFAPDRSRSPVEEIYAHHAAADEAVDRAVDANEKLSAETKRLRVLATRRVAFAQTPASVPARRLELLDGSSLEDLVAELLRRDGLTLRRDRGGPKDQGADLIAETPDGQRIVLQSKFRQSRPVGPRVVYELKGTARELHGADIAVVVTNSHYSDQSIADAATLGIHLVDGHGLQCWATWGDSVYDVLQLAPSPVLAA